MKKKEIWITAAAVGAIWLFWMWGRHHYPQPYIQPSAAYDRSNAGGPSRPDQRGLDQPFARPFIPDWRVAPAYQGPQSEVESWRIPPRYASGTTSSLNIPWRDWFLKLHPTKRFV